MFPQIEIKHNIGNTIAIPNQLDIRATAYTTDNFTIGATSVPVTNSSDFTSGTSILLLLSSLAAQNAEIVTSSSHTNTAMTISPAIQNHNRGESVQELNWDSVVIYKSATLGGPFTQLVVMPLQVTQMNTIVFDSAGLASDYYKVQWRNSVTGNTSSQSDAISVLTYLPESAGALILSVMSLFGIQENDKQITPGFLLGALNDARQVVESRLYGIRQPWKGVFEYPIKVLAGRNYIELPDDIDFNVTDQSLLSARFLTNNILFPYNMKYVDKRTWNQSAFYNTGGITQQDYTIGATTIRLNSVGDFAPQGGQAQVSTNDFNEVVISINYTSIDYTTNELLGVTGLTRNIQSGTQIWATTNMSQPMFYTVYDNRIWFSALIPGSMQGNNCYIDYYRKMFTINNLYDVIPEHYREMYKPYLRWAIKYRKDITVPTSDPDLVKFDGLVEALFNNLYTGQETVIITS